jgi:hypothetical protein
MILLDSDHLNALRYRNSDRGVRLADSPRPKTRKLAQPS